MSEPRFLLVWGCTKDGLPIPAWPTTAGRITSSPSGPGGCWCSWRLLGANNRELGRGAQIYADDAECLAAMCCGQAGVIGAVSETLPQTGQWAWRFSTAEGTFAVSPRAYQRQRECHYSLQQFMLGLVSARVPSLGSVVEKIPAGCRPRSLAAAT